MFNVIHRTIRWCTLLVFAIAVMDEVWRWFDPSTKNVTFAEWVTAWAVLCIYEVFEQLAKWERQQQGLPDHNVFAVPPFDTSVPLDLRLRELLAQNKRIEALRQIRGYKNVSLDEAKEYLKQFEQANVG